MVKVVHHVGEQGGARLIQVLSAQPAKESLNIISSGCFGAGGLYEAGLGAPVKKAGPATMRQVLWARAYFDNILAIPPIGKFRLFGELGECVRDSVGVDGRVDMSHFVEIVGVGRRRRHVSTVVGSTAFHHIISGLLGEPVDEMIIDLKVDYNGLAIEVSQSVVNRAFDVSTNCVVSAYRVRLDLEGSGRCGHGRVGLPVVSLMMNGFRINREP